jgi:hypothetical protein
MKCLQNTTQRREEPLHWSAFCGFAALGALRPQRPRTFAKLHRSVCGTQPASSKTDAPADSTGTPEIRRSFGTEIRRKNKKMPPGTENGSENRFYTGTLEIRPSFGTENRRKKKEKKMLGTELGSWCASRE